MEEHRCKVAAAQSADRRCSNLLESAQIEVEDRRHSSVHSLFEIEVEDHRCNSVSIAFEDPRCQGLISKW